MGAADAVGSAVSSDVGAARYSCAYGICIRMHKAYASLCIYKGP